MLCVAIIGCGAQGEAHAKAYLATGKCEILWVYDTDREKAEKFAKTLPSLSAENYARVLSDSRVRIVSIASYDSAHAGQVTDALSCGKNVFCEKPLCRSLGDLKVIKQAVEVFDHALAVNLPLRTAPAYRWLKEAIQAGEFGEIYAMNGQYLYGRLHKITGGWRKDEEDYSVMLGGGIHLVGLMLWLTGQRPEWVTAAGNKICTQGTAFRYKDFATATFGFPSGMIGQVTANFGCMHPHARPLEVYGTKGTVIVTGWEEVFVFRRRSYPAGPVFESPEPEEGALIPPFVDVVEQEQEVDSQLDFDSTAACIAAEAALRSGGKESVVYV